MKEGVVCLPGVLRSSNVANEDVAVSNLYPLLGDVMHTRGRVSKLMPDAMLAPPTAAN